MIYKNSMTPKTNNELKNSNIKGIFLNVQAANSVLRRSLQERTGLSWGNISLNVNRLCEMGVIIESNQEETSVGRKPQYFDINPDDNYLIGLDIQKTMIYAVVTDLKGREKYKYTHSLSYTDKTAVLSELYSITDTILEKLPGKKIIALGIAVQGIVSKDNTISKYFPGLADWDKVNLKILIENRYNIRCFVYHDPDATMCAEKLFRNAKDASLKNVALIRLDNGVGLSIMINREIITSSSGKSGELGHIIVDKDGLLCNCGDRGCLDPYVTDYGIIKRFITAIEQGENTSVNVSDLSTLSINVLATAAKNGDALCKNLFAEMGEYLGIGISSYINIFNPQLIIIVGEFTKYTNIFEQEMHDSIIRHVWNTNETKIVFSKYNQYIAAIGAALACFDKILNDASDFEQVFAVDAYGSMLQFRII